MTLVDLSNIYLQDQYTRWEKTALNGCSFATPLTTAEKTPGKKLRQARLENFFRSTADVVADAVELDLMFFVIIDEVCSSRVVVSRLADTAAVEYLPVSGSNGYYGEMFRRAGIKAEKFFLVSAMGTWVWPTKSTLALERAKDLIT